MRGASALTLLVLATSSAPAFAIPSELTFELTLDADEVRILPAGAYDDIRILGEPGWVSADYLGEPHIPSRFVRILLPPDAEVVSVDVTAASSVVLAEDVVPTPVELAEAVPGEDGYVEPDSTLYGSSEPYPADPVRRWTTQFMRGVQILSVAVTPLEYIGADRELRRIPTLTLRASLEALDTREARGVRERRRAGSRWTLEQVERTWLLSTVLNPESFTAFYGEEITPEDPPTARTDQAAGGFVPTERPSLDGSRVAEVIITDNVDLAGRSVGDMIGEFEKLAEWKTLRGVPAVVRTVTWIRESYPGLDISEKIRRFVTEAYELWGVDWLLLGGDVNVVPSRRTIPEAYGGGEQPADAYYGCLDGTWNADNDLQFGELSGDAVDEDFEVFVGRAPVETEEEAANFVLKTREYERDPSLNLVDLGQTYERALFMATLTNSSRWGVNGDDNGIYAGHQISEMVQGAHPSHERLFYAEPLPLIANCCGAETRMRFLMQPDTVEVIDPETIRLWTDASASGFSHGDTRDVLTQVNGGVGLIHHTAHSTPYMNGRGGKGLSNDCSEDDCDKVLKPFLPGAIVAEQVRTLTNAGRYPLMWSTASGSNSYFQESISEEWINARRAGAVAYVGTAHSFHPANFPVRIAVDFFEKLIQDDVVHAGQTTGLTMQEAATGLGPITLMTYQLLGDPELKVWRDTPGELSMIVLETNTGSRLLDFSFGMTGITAVVRDGSGVPVVGAVVCVKQADRIYAVRLTGAGGRAVFPALDFVSDDDVIVTASSNDHAPVQDTYGFSETGPFVTYDSHDVDVTTGNTNDVLDAGEQARVDVWLENAGRISTNRDFEATLRPYGDVNVLDLTFYGDSTSVGNVFIGATRTNPDPADAGSYGFPIARSRHRRARRAGDSSRRAGRVHLARSGRREPLVSRRTGSSSTGRPRRRLHGQGKDTHRRRLRRRQRLRHPPPAPFPATEGSRSATRSSSPPPTRSRSRSRASIPTRCGSAPGKSIGSRWSTEQTQGLSSRRGPRPSSRSSRASTPASATPTPRRSRLM